MTTYIYNLRKYTWALLKKMNVLVLSWDVRDAGYWTDDPVQAQIDLGVDIEDIDDSYDYAIVFPKNDPSLIKLSTVVHETIHIIQDKLGMKNRFIMELSAYTLQWILIHHKCDSFYNTIKYGMEYSCHGNYE